MLLISIDMAPSHPNSRALGLSLVFRINHRTNLNNPYSVNSLSTTRSPRKLNLCSNRQVKSIFLEMLGLTVLCHRFLSLLLSRQSSNQELSLLLSFNNSNNKHQSLCSSTKLSTVVSPLHLSINKVS